MEWVRVKERVRFSEEKMQKILLLRGGRGQLDLYCLRPGQAQRPHIHDDLDKIYLGVEGAGRVTIGGEERSLEPGEAVLAPAGAEHGVFNDGPGPLVMAVFVAPPPPH